MIYPLLIFKAAIIMQETVDILHLVTHCDSCQNFCFPNFKFLETASSVNKNSEKNVLTKLLSAKIGPYNFSFNVYQVKKLIASHQPGVYIDACNDRG